MHLTLAQAAQVTGGRIARGAGWLPLGRIVTDSRAIAPGDVFLALRGDRFRGEDFLAQAIARGAIGIIVTSDASHEPLPPNVFELRVPDTTRALGALARAWRRSINPRVAAISGSAGKTTTKDMAAHLCAGSLAIHSTSGNKNNHIGLPLTLLALEPNHAACVVEVGMNHSGELTELAAIAEPDISALTNVGDAHLGNFRGPEELIAAKAELIAGTSPRGTAILNLDCPACRLIRSTTPMPRTVFTFGEAEGADFRAHNVRPLGDLGYAFDLEMFQFRAPVQLHIFGRYQVRNALAAAALALLLGVPPDAIVERLHSFEAPSLRSSVEDAGGLRLIVDCYNASPAATVAALRSFAEMPHTGRRIAVLGEMAELGDFSDNGHRTVGIACRDLKLDLVVAIGHAARSLAEEAATGHGQVEWFSCREEAVDFLRAECRPGDAVLIKGSRVAKLEDVAGALRTPGTPLLAEGVIA